MMCDPGVGVLCEDCDGYGYIEVDYRRHQCVHCHGTGEIDPETIDALMEEQWQEAERNS